jgi:Domain of unknown function (DUF4406)
MKIYIAGPYSHPDPIANTRTAILAAEEVIKKGHVPYIPHLTLLWHIVVPHRLEFWYEYDKVWLRFCNALLRLPGESKGADEEVALARKLCLPLYYTLDQIPQGDLHATPS